MIEVPSAAMTSDILSEKADFLSIGTNDLIQYSIAIDRGNEKVAHMYQPLHPGLLRMIHLGSAECPPPRDSRQPVRRNGRRAPVYARSAGSGAGRNQYERL